MYRYSISKEDTQKCIENYLNSRFRKIDIFGNIMLCIFILILWFCMLALFKYLHDEYSDSNSGWIRTWPLPGNIVDYFYIYSAIILVSCLIQKKKFDKLKWCNIVKTEKHQNRLSSTFEKMTKGKSWEEPDLMEYDSETMEIRVLNKNPKTYTIPSNWEDSLVKVGDNLYYGLLTVNTKKIIIPFRFE